MHKKLFIPGPVEVKPEVLTKMATPMIGHRGSGASALQRSISEKLQQVFTTSAAILLSTSSGTGLMEGAVRSCTAARAACFSVGAFGKRWYEIAQNNGVPADCFEVPWGQANTAEQLETALSSGKYDLMTITHNETSTGVMNPLGELSSLWKRYPEVVVCVDAVSSMGGTYIPVDDWGIDICITSSQKALGLPPGLAMCSFSPKAIARAGQVEHRGFYFDLLALYDYIQSKDFQYPSTPSLSHMFALDYQLDCILQEGLEQRYARHREMAAVVRAWAREHFALFAEEKYLSDTLTTITNTRNVDVSALNQALGQRGWQISNGYGKMKDKTFRIAHMADATVGEIRALLADMDDVLGLS